MHSRQGFGVMGEMIKIRNKRTVALRLSPHALTLAVLVLAVVGCSGSKVTTKSSAELPRYQIRTIAMVPFTILTTPQVRDAVDHTFSAPPGARRSDMTIAVPSNTEQPLRQTVTVPASAGDIVTQLLWSRLRTRQGVTVLAPSEVANALASPSNTEQPLRQTVTVPASAGDIVTQLLWSRLRTRQGVTVLAPSEVANALASPSTPQSPASQSQAVAVAKQLKADASLIGQVSVYQERVGGRFGASPPATVGFEAKVVAADGQVLWEGNYYEKQGPMIEDFMGFIHRHGVFVTAEELASYGVDHMLLEFPFGSVGER